MNDVVAVVVTYNRKKLLKECIEALLKSSFPCDVLVIDNCSTDGTKEYIADIIDNNSNVSYQKLAENVGGAGGFANGMNLAVKQGYEYVWIMDDDTIVNEKSLEMLMDGADILLDDFGFLSSTVNWTDGKPCKMNAQTFNRRPTGIQSNYETQGLKSVTAATFVSLLFRRDVILSMGLPIKEYFIWGDDKEYTSRVSAKYNCYNVSGSTVTHKMGNNKGSNIKTDDIKRIDRYFYAYRNDLATAKNRGVIAVAVYLAGFALNYFRVSSLKDNSKNKRLDVMRKGLFAGITFNPSIKYVKIN